VHWVLGSDFARLGKRWIAQTVHKGDPGSIQTGRLLELVQSFPNQREATVKGLHHLQDDSPKEIGEALRAFVLGKEI
jgi:haloalkane dehalogenase